MSMMIRSHSVVPTGIEKFSDNLMTITSCSNHSGTHENDATILVIQKQLIISPKIIKAQSGSSVHWQEINMSTISASANSSVRRETTPPRKRQSLAWLNDGTK